MATRMSLHTRALCAAIAVGLGPAAAGAQTPQHSAGDAAFLFAYRAKPGQETAFFEGYRRHLDWHKAHADSLTWLAWTVYDGSGVDTFVDGTFGIPFAAFDQRVDPRGDGADAMRNVSAFADAIWREVFRLRRDLGSSTRLEDGKPAPMQRVVYVTVRPGRELLFEQALRTLRGHRGRTLDYAAYERVSGGDEMTYVLVVGLAAWADLQDPAREPTRVVLRDAAAAVAHVRSETWILRPELVYAPNR
jgi:hypothetical protein